MIDVRMRENDRIEFLRFAVKPFIFCACFGPVTLEEAAVEQDATLSGFEQVLTAGDFTSGSEKRQLHGFAPRSNVPRLRPQRTEAGAGRRILKLPIGCDYSCSFGLINSQRVTVSPSASFARATGS